MVRFMRNFLIATTAILVAPALTSCATTLPPPDGVRMTSQIAHPENCELVGEVRGDNNLYGGYFMHDVAEKSANSQILQNAAKLGANTVLVEESTTGILGANMRGKAYRCPPE